jgi:hypothetical protein
MQKVEGSSPFSRSEKAPHIAGFFDALTQTPGHQMTLFGSRR